MLNTIFQPLEQFEIVLLRPIKLGSLDFSFTNLSLYLVFAFSVFYFIFVYALRDLKIVPTTFYQFLAESIYKFVGGMVSQQIGRKGRHFFVLIFTVFSFILFCNLIGLTPYGFTATSHIIQTFTLAASLFIGIVILGVVTLKAKFLLLFWPSGVPMPLMFLLVPIEIISYVARCFSLPIRLFANMMSGHTLLYILSSFVIQLGNKHFLFGLLPVIIITAIAGLELGIAVVQAYVFTVLLCIYISDSVHVKDH